MRLAEKIGYLSLPLRPYDLPPMTALVSFEAAARHVSFKAAAGELNVTAVSYTHLTLPTKA